ncbi:MAG: 3,4-dihydroxy-2-butanone-4-phosphate synthase [Proteobacteria bacterium]|nr:3,4-dihydroxy-2-butanone-4-phosphate synthase [Pseudomonadota bacterium]
MNHSVNRVIQAIEAIRSGQMVILVDDEDRENEGDLTMAAEKVTPEAVNFMATYGRGLICLALDENLIEKLKLPMMVRNNEATLETAFTISIEARRGVTTGISARDRATTIRTAIAEDAQADDLVSPGHVFPLRARPGGVLVRTGQTEGSVDLARLAGLKPAGVICEIMREDGEMARMPDLERFSAEHGIMIVSIADLIAYRLHQEPIVKRRLAGEIRPRCVGPGEPFQTYLYGTDVEETEYLALVRGDIAAAAAADKPVLVRVQSICPIGDPFGTRPEMEVSLHAIDEAGVGVFLYVYNKARTSLSRSFGKQVLRHEGQGEPSDPDRMSGRSAAAPSNDSALYSLPEQPDGNMHSQALRDFGLGAQVLADLGCQKVRLLSNHDRRIAGIEGFGIEVVDRVPIRWSPAPELIGDRDSRVTAPLRAVRSADTAGDLSPGKTISNTKSSDRPPGGKPS